MAEEALSATAAASGGNIFWGFFFFRSRGIGSTVKFGEFCGFVIWKICANVLLIF